MRVAVLGSGPSLPAFQHPERYGMIIGANDMAQRYPDIPFTHISAMDTKQQVLKNRPLIADTPEHITLLFQSPSWEGYAHPGTTILKTRSLNYEWSLDSWKATEPLHGHHTPIFSICYAFYCGAERVDIFGVDCSIGHPLNSWQSRKTTILQINWLSKWANINRRELNVCGESELWGQVVQGHKLECGKLWS